MALHLGRLAAITASLLLCIFYPFLPGGYDGLAMALSTMAQTAVVVGLLFVPVGILWLVHEARNGARRKQGLPHPESGYRFSVVSVVVASIVAIAVSVSAGIAVGRSFGLLAFALWIYAAATLIPRLKLLRTAERASLNPVPLYLAVVPVAVLLCQRALAGPAAEFSRNRAIDNSAEVVNDIERFHTAHGHYPGSLLAVWPDYKPSVIGIEQYHYARQGDAYNLVFEQPSFRWGTREFVVYNKLDEHFFPSHAEWNLRSTPEALSGREGWYAVHDAARPHWKYFWFD